MFSYIKVTLDIFAWKNLEKKHSIRNILYSIICYYTVWCRNNTVNFPTNIHKRQTPHGSPVRARYGVSFVDLASDWYSASVPVIIYVIPCNIRLCYNGSWLYLVHHYRQTSDIRCIFVGNIIVDHSDVIGASPVGAAPTTSSFST